MEGHAAIAMSVAGSGSFERRLGSWAGFTSINHTFVMERAAVLRDIVVGLLLTGAAAARIPGSFGSTWFSPTLRW